ncbi:hypothetical protein BN1088_470008 [Sphingobacterium sp. PM2-P1-29]|nr:hypothetical protein BN1088_470008 [Sphingobacterium sp. PM2-P1-29]
MMDLLTQKFPVFNLFFVACGPTSVKNAMPIGLGSVFQCHAIVC